MKRKNKIKSTINNLDILLLNLMINVVIIPSDVTDVTNYFYS